LGDAIVNKNLKYGMIRRLVRLADQSRNGVTYKVYVWNSTNKC